MFPDDFGQDSGSGGRYPKRLARFQSKGKRMPKTQHFLWWLLHNFVAHPFLCIPCRWSFAFHDWSSRKLGRQCEYGSNKARFRALSYIAKAGRFSFAARRKRELGNQ